MHPMWERIEPLIPEFLSDVAQESNEEIISCLERIFFDWFLSRVRNNSADAEDLAARTLERICLYRQTFQYRGIGSFRAWCYRIVKNVFTDWVDAEEKWGAHTVSDDEWRDLEDTTSVVDPPYYDEDISEPPEVLSVRNVFQMLTALEQAALAMQVIDGCSDIEIALRLKSTPQAIKQARYRARQKFRELLSADPQFANIASQELRPNSNLPLNGNSEPQNLNETTVNPELEYRCDEEEK